MARVCDIPKSPRARKRGRSHGRFSFTHSELTYIQQLKEAFRLIDHDCDGFISREDLRKTLTSLGQAPKEDCLESMLQETKGPVNLTMFLSLFTSTPHRTDPEEDLRKAFACLDCNGDGSISVQEFRSLLMTMGDRLTEQEVQEVFACAKLDIQNGFLDYNHFIKVLSSGDPHEFRVEQPRKVKEEEPTLQRNNTNPGPSRSFIHEKQPTTKRKARYCRSSNI